MSNQGERDSQPTQNIRNELVVLRHVHYKTLKTIISSIQFFLCAKDRTDEPCERDLWTDGILSGCTFPWLRGLLSGSSREWVVGRGTFTRWNLHLRGLDISMWSSKVLFVFTRRVDSGRV